MGRCRVTGVTLFLTLALGACNFPLLQKETAPTDAPETSAQTPAADSISRNDMQIPSAQRIDPADLVYLGAFRLPEGAGRPSTFEYGGAAMTFNPNGDPGGGADGFPGSLFIMGHDRLPYGELPNGNMVAEVSIPAPIPGELGNLNTSGFVQDFSDVLRGHFNTLEELPRAGMLYLDTPLTGPLIHVTFGAHFQEDAAQQVASHAWISPDLSHPDFTGTWFIGSQSLYSVNGYLFEVPSEFAEAYLGGRKIASGRFRDGGWSGMGPELFAYLPWDDRGDPLPDQARLQEAVLLRYADSLAGEDFSRAMNGYSHADEWEGGAWLTTPDRRSAVVFVGTKAVGAYTWYGWQNPADPARPCIETELLGQFTLCRLADGSACPPSDLLGCSGHNDYRGWWSDAFSARMLFYDPSDLAKVANGQMQPWEPQPYAVLEIDEQLLQNPDGVELEMLGAGSQRRYRVGEMAYDRENNLIYVLEWFADGAKPVVHVWRVQ